MEVWTNTRATQRIVADARSWTYDGPVAKSEDARFFGNDKIRLRKVLPFLLSTSLLLEKRHFPAPHNYLDLILIKPGRMDAYHSSR